MIETAMLAREDESLGRSGRHESTASGVSWSAILAGAFVAAALSLILLALGSGLGFSSVSPWENSGASAKAIGIGAALWLMIMQIVSAGAGGYLAGRLRTQWANLHGDEVFFRDTAHGFVVWAVGTVVTAALLTSAAGTLVGGAAKTATAAAGAVGAAGAGVAGMAADQMSGGATSRTAYSVDSLLRPATASADGAAAPGSAAPAANAPAGGAQSGATTPGNSSGGASMQNGGANQSADAGTRAELGRIFSTGMHNGELSPADKTYVSQTIAARAGISQADADKRVNDAIAQLKNAEAEARQAADAARKAAAYLSLWIFVSLLAGAFCASYAATVGGRTRDGISA